MTGNNRLMENKLVAEFNYGTYTNDLTRDIALNAVKIHLRKQIDLLKSVSTNPDGTIRKDIVEIMCSLEEQRAELF